MKQSRSQGVSWGDLDDEEKKFITTLVRLSDFEVVDWILTFTATGASLNRPAGHPTFPDPRPDEAFYRELARKGFLRMTKQAASRQLGIDRRSTGRIWPTAEAVDRVRFREGAWE